MVIGKESVLDVGGDCNAQRWVDLGVNDDLRHRRRFLFRQVLVFLDHCGGSSLGGTCGRIRLLGMVAEKKLTDLTSSAPDGHSTIPSISKLRLTVYSLRCIFREYRLAAKGDRVMWEGQ